MNVWRELDGADGCLCSVRFTTSQQQWPVASNYVVALFSSGAADSGWRYLRVSAETGKAAMLTGFSWTPSGTPYPLRGYIRNSVSQQ